MNVHKIMRQIDNNNKIDKLNIFILRNHNSLIQHKYGCYLQLIDFI